jgi:hypothetical protein
MLDADINPKTLEALCPTCKENNFKIFRRYQVFKKIYYNHCKCEICGQLFIYKVSKVDNIILEKEMKKYQSNL